MPPQEERRRFIDVHFDDTVRNPILVVERIYAHFGKQVSDEHRRAMLRYIDANPRKSSAGSFDKQQFGVTEAMVARAFDSTNNNA